MSDELIRPGCRGVITRIYRQRKTQVLRLILDNDEEGFRRVSSKAPVEEGDLIWWEVNTGYLVSADGLYGSESEDYKIGPCLPCECPEREWTRQGWVDVEH